MSRPTLTEAKARDLADHSTRLVQRIATRLPAAVAHLRDAQPGPRSTPTDGGGHAGRNEWRMLDDALALSRDEARSMQVDLAKLFGQVLDCLERIDVICAKAMPATRTAPVDPDVCQACARHGHREPLGDRRYRVGGMLVGEWAHAFHVRIGRLPNKAEVDQHAQGRRVKVRAG